MKLKPKKRFYKAIKVKNTLKRVLNRSVNIKKNVKQAAGELVSVNQTLKKGKEGDVSNHKIKKAIDRNEVVEKKVTKAAGDLKQVNSELAKEVTARVVIESELSDVKTTLAEVRVDLSKSQASEEEAYKDTPTGLPNRVSFEQSFDQALIQAKRHCWGFAVLFIDIDKFKSINDSYGHDCGDGVLLMVANRLRSCIRAGDAVSRWGATNLCAYYLKSIK